MLGAVTGVVGALLAGGGLWLVALGGSPYYLVTGIAYLVAGALLRRRRSVGAWHMAALLGITICGALWEVGFDYWALFPRAVVPAGLALLALTAAMRFPANGSPRTMAIAAGLLAVAIAVDFGMAFVPHGVVGNALGRPFGDADESELPQPEPTSNWSPYGGTDAGTRYSPFTEISRANVVQLQSAWTFRPGDSHPGTDQSTPLQIGEVLYTCTRNNHGCRGRGYRPSPLRYDPGVQQEDWAHCRGVGYYELPDASGNGAVPPVCKRRIYGATLEAQPIAVDASTGQPCSDVAPPYGIRRDSPYG